MENVRQNAYIGENEDKAEIQMLLSSDRQFLMLMQEIWRYYLQKQPDEIGCNVVNNGCVTTIPRCYFYFENMYTIVGSSTRHLVMGCVCLALGLCAIVEVDFYIYPKKSMYIATDRVWSPPFWWVTTNIQLVQYDEEYEGSFYTFLYEKTKLFMAAVDQCVQSSDEDLRE
ncbi:Hypothetical predicted protein, partial [Paramuricea clavata]